MKTLHLNYDAMVGPVRDHVAAISGRAIRQTSKDVYMDLIYRVAGWGASPKALHDRAKAMCEAFIGGRHGRPARDEHGAVRVGGEAVARIGASSPVVLADEQ